MNLCLGSPIPPLHLTLPSLPWEISVPSFYFQPNSSTCHFHGGINSPPCLAPLSRFPNVLGLCPSSAPVVHALKLHFSLNPSASPALRSPLERRSTGAICRAAFLVEVASPKWKPRCRIITTSPSVSVASSHQASRHVNPQPAVDVSGCLPRWVQDMQPWEGCCQRECTEGRGCRTVPSVTLSVPSKEVGLRWAFMVIQAGPSCISSGLCNRDGSVHGLYSHGPSVSHL